LKSLSSSSSSSSSSKRARNSQRDGKHDSCDYDSNNYGGDVDDKDDDYLPPVSVSVSSAADYEPPFIDLTYEDDHPVETDIYTIINPTISSDNECKKKSIHSNNKRSSQQVNKTTTITTPNNRSKQRKSSSSSSSSSSFIVPNTASSMKSINSTDDDSTCITRVFDPALKVIIMTATDAKSNFTLFEDIQPSFVILYDAGECN
jgi:hypothetical protein